MSIFHKQKKLYRKTKEEVEEKDLLIRLLLGFAFLLILTAFLHFREVRVDTLEIDHLAKNYVVAQVDFQFPDPDTTMVLKQEALRDIGRIYKINESEIKQARDKFENYLIHHPGWRKGNDATFEEMYNALDAVVETLISANLTDARTLKKREEVGLSVINYYVVLGLDSENQMMLPDSFWDAITEKIVSSYHFNARTIEIILDYFKASKWKLYTDIDSQSLFRQNVEREVPEKYTKVKAGSRIIDQGEKVTSRHVAMLAAMKKAIADGRNLWTMQTIITSLLYALMIMLIGSLYLYKRQPDFLKSKRQLALYITILTLLLAFAKITEWLILHSDSSAIDFVRYPILVPFASVLLCLLLNQEISLISTFIFTVVMGITLAFEHSYFLFINLITGMCAVIASTRIKKRKEIFLVCFKIWLAAGFVIVIFNFTNGTIISSTLPIDLITAAINLIIIAVLLIFLMPLLESLFNVMTDITLMEYMDPTNELLKRLSIEAPGTYQHSLSLGHIAEFVANSIGANGLFCRVTTLYHDVGKLNTPHYYTENQMVSGAKPFNIHQLLTPVESAYIIKSHVPDGVALARQNKLPQPFIDIIEQHHGTTLIRFFYAKQVEEMGGNPDDVDESAFRYPGPKPQTKEAAIIMLADSTEAASRSLEDNSEHAIRELIDRIVFDKINDGQFDECPLTFKELFLIKTKLVEMIKATHHLRIKYPERPKSVS